MKWKRTREATLVDLGELRTDSKEARLARAARAMEKGKERKGHVREGHAFKGVGAAHRKLLLLCPQ